MNLSFDSPFVIPAAALSAGLAVLKVTCVLLAALLVSAMMRRRSAGARHLVWLVALIAALVLPLLSVWSPLPVRVLPAAAPPAHVQTSIAEAGVARSTAVETAPLASTDPVAASVTSRPIGMGTVLLAIWALGVVVLLVRLALGAWVIRRIVRRARILVQEDWQQPLYDIADRLGLDDAPQLVQSDRIKMPFATGFLKAAIVLPAESALWTSERRCAVLIHELAHVKRRDLVGHMVGAIACALYWFHPLVWKATRHLRSESERACDDLALMLGTPAIDYAEHLLEIVTQVRDERMPAVALAMAKPREFEGRMLAILDPRHYRRAPGRVQAAWLVGSLTALALVVGAVSPARRVTASPPAPAAGDTNAPLALEEGSDRSEPAKLAEAAAEETPKSATQPESRPEQLAQVQDGAQVQDEAQAQEEAQVQDESGTDTDAAPSTKASHRVQLLAKSLRTDSDAEVRRVAAWGLARYAGSQVAAMALAEAVTGEENKEVREMATWALSGSRTRAAVTALEAALHDKSPEVRRTAVWAIGSIGARSSVEALTKLLPDADPSVREIAAWAIGSCSPKLAPAALVRLLGDADRDVRLSAAWALYEIGDASTADEIEASFRREKDKEVQHGLIRALGSMGERSIPTLTRLVDSSDPQIRAVAVAALAGGNITGPWPWPRPEPRPYP